MYANPALADAVLRAAPRVRRIAAVTAVRQGAGPLTIRIDVDDGLDYKLAVSPSRLINALGRDMLYDVVDVATSSGLPRIAVVFSRPTQQARCRREVKFHVTPTGPRVGAAWTLASTLADLTMYCRGDRPDVGEREIGLIKEAVWDCKCGAFVQETADVPSRYIDAREVVPGFNAWPCRHGFLRMELPRSH